MKSLIVPMILCWNELVYLKNLIPQYQQIADEIVILDGNSTDGTKEWFTIVKDKSSFTNVKFYQREFDTCANQFDYALQKCPKDNTWIINLTADELPTIWFFDNIRAILDDCEALGMD